MVPLEKTLLMAAHRVKYFFPGKGGSGIWQSEFKGSCNGTDILMEAKYPGKPIISQLVRVFPVPASQAATCIDQQGLDGSLLLVYSSIHQL
jgi:hypothetical protein